MVRPVKGICDDCKTAAEGTGLTISEKWLSKKHPPLCNYHNVRRKKKKKLVKIRFEKLKLKKATGEKEVFKEIWDVREHVCTGCGESLGNEARTFHFSHIIKKSKSETLRLDTDNIVLECYKCHEKWDFGVLLQKKKMNNFQHKMEYIKNNDMALWIRLNK